MANNHGWEMLGYVDGGRAAFAPIISEQRRCACPVADIFGCRREATQEDLLCDECRETCPVTQTPRDS